MNRNTEIFAAEIERLKAVDNFRIFPQAKHEGKYIFSDGKKMLNLSSNDYLGIASEGRLWKEFISSAEIDKELPSSSSSRLLTGNFPEYEELEDSLSALFGKESALVFNSGYHANTGILPALCGHDTLILADKLVHASIIDGIRLSGADYIRYRHNDYVQLERLVKDNSPKYRTIFIVTESIFSMDGDEADLVRLAEIKQTYGNIMLYADEAHAFGLRGEKGTGCAEEKGVSGEIDLLVGTFGKAAASMGAYVVCDNIIREYLINKMRTLIFSTALPPLNIKWTNFVINRIPSMKERRERLGEISAKLRDTLKHKGINTPSTSHIIPVITGDSGKAILKAKNLQDAGFYVLPVRPPTVPVGSSRLRLSMTANIPDEDTERLSKLL
ncbi:MAG: 8-amino-7-oxononanoate synthase [Bacteroidetes bacterium]|uniref:8-amino-7-oxononanoate synthase n=1 Tax=Candidatus Merdivivens pullistercoris TaxID=2840873 RepID=A0A9D9I3S8_9BACT|nr:8-amino-7-oxononanoate synthase [Candidatus Merdivivens pullistercoris]